MKIGIIGTSHSQGRQPCTNGLTKDEIKNFWQNKNSKFTKPFEDHLQNAMPECDFFNLAASGRGSERYLECVVQLKKKYNIDALLLEISADRTANTFYRCEHKMQQWEKDLLKNPNNIDNFIDEFFNQNGLYTCSVNKVFDDQDNGILNNVPESKLKIWRQIQSIIFQQSAQIRLLGMKSIKQTHDMCKMLNIKVIPWNFRITDINVIPINESIPFNEWMEKNGLGNNYCDGWHGDDIAYSRGAKEYFKPLIETNLE